VASPILCRHLASALERWQNLRPSSRPLPDRLTRVVNLALASTLTLAAGVWAGDQLGAPTLEAHVDRHIPTSAFEWLAARPAEGNLFHSYNWGGYVLWRLYPEYSSFVDGRTDVFSPEVLQDYVTTWSAGPGWEAVLDEHDIRVVLVEPASPLGPALDTAGWAAVYEDEDSVIYRRTAAR
jgi:hypothetical protein